MATPTVTIKPDLFRSAGDDCKYSGGEVRVEGSDGAHDVEK
jgi:hypothetical protein